jgi:imidazolonepropionase-like amidohydrolase
MTKEQPPPRSTQFRVLIGIVAITALCGVPFAASRVAELASSEHGVFLLHDEERLAGKETYDISSDGAGVMVTVDFNFANRGRNVPLSATFKGQKDWTPIAFQIKGHTSRTTTIDQAVEVQSGKAHIRSRADRHNVDTPQRFFTIAGYSPTTMQMLLLRYWRGHGSPKQLDILPRGGQVEIIPRGWDTVTVSGRKVSLQRYLVDGLIWGHESLWADTKGDLVAVVTLSAELAHFEAIREGYEDALGALVGLAGKDGMNALAELRNQTPIAKNRTIAIVGGTLIDGNGGAPVQDAAVIVRDGRIVAVGPAAVVAIPNEAYRVEADGKTILPGLWDMHSHFEQVEWGPIYLAAGVTTARDCGNEFEFITAVRDAIREDRGVGPRLLLAGVVDGTSPESAGVQRVDTPEQALYWTRRYHDAGFQQMKIYSSVKLEEEKVVIAEAHRLGMTVTGHVPQGLDAYQTISAGQDQINHISYVADIMHPLLPPNADRVAHKKAAAAIDIASAQAAKAIEFLKAHKTVLDPTLATFEIDEATTEKPVASIEPGANFIAPELVQTLTDVEPPSEASRLQEQVDAKYLVILGALHRAGIPIVAGTDQTIPGHSIHREIELYVRAGFTPMEAIQAATVVPARAMGLDKDSGSVEVGKRADLIVIDGDPLTDIRNTRNVTAVIANGELFDPSVLWRSVGFKPWEKH